MTLGSFILESREQMLEHMKWIVADLQRAMLNNTEEYTEPGCDEPSIDVRLCIDRYERNEGWRFIFRTGLSDYDPYHSYLCAGSCVTLDTDPDELLEELLDDVFEQHHGMGGRNDA